MTFCSPTSLRIFSIKAMRLVRPPMGLERSFCRMGSAWPWWSLVKRMVTWASLAEETAGKRSNKQKMLTRSHEDSKVGKREKPFFAITENPEIEFKTGFV